MRRNRIFTTGMAGATALLLILALMAAGQTPAPRATPSTAHFEAKIRPLLLTSCVSCHGKESAAHSGGLRLDVPLTLTQAKEVVRRVNGQGDKPRMPLGSVLPKEQITALERWVREGAPWPAGKTLSVPGLREKGKKHWAFQPLKRPSVPRVRAKSLGRNPIDALVLQRLEAKGLSLAPPASRRELIRRLSYDLTGLPPTIEEVAAFVSDSAPDAYTKLVDRLLASPHYGEKWGRHWLDLVRYAETNSYERDNPKPHVYKYRDYVIQAFNQDMPYDRFLKEQLAGDELPGSTGATLVATGYYRLGIWDDEPAALKQAEYDDLDDLVATTGQAFLGLTLDCARCHDHKLDPISQKDYYRFAALFQNINRFRNGGPTDEAVYFATEEQKREYEARVAGLERKRAANQGQLEALVTAHRAQRTRLLNPADLSEVKYRYFEGTWERLPDFDTLPQVATGNLTSLFLDIRPRKRDVNFAFVFEGVLNVPQDGEYTFFMDTDDGSRLTVGGKKVLEKDASGGQGTEMKGALKLTAGPVPFRVEYFQGAGPFGLSLAWGGPGFPRRPLSTLESCAADGLPVVQSAEIPLVLGAEKGAQYGQLLKEKAELATQNTPAEKVLCVTEAGPKAAEMFVLQRGNIATPGEKVGPGFPLCAGGGPAVVPPPPADAKTTGRRTALANWLTASDNPLTARVMVNRIWQHHFGRGIVRSPNDFGLQGVPPTHPELLNWLAVEFQTKGWSVKKLHRLILTSSVYRQSSRGNPAARRIDPENDLFGRFDLRRLSAEEIRDSLLAVAGNLNLAQFGPPVYPEIPKEVLAGQSIPGAGWQTDKMKPEDQNRRSIYIHVKRSLIYPMLAIFDLPETDHTSAARFVSTQPTQALGMMNSGLVNRQAAVLAGRIYREVGGNDKRAFARRLLSVVLQRTPGEKEIAECLRLMERLKKRGATPEQARTYLCLMALNLNEFIYVD